MPQGDFQPRFESLVDRRIREAAERGEFDDLPGSGEPLEILDEPYEANWWLKRWFRREKVSLAELEEAGVAERWRRRMRRRGAR